jgi:hypothetical protein
MRELIVSAIIINFVMYKLLANVLWEKVFGANHKQSWITVIPIWFLDSIGYSIPNGYVYAKPNASARNDVTNQYAESLSTNTEVQNQEI